MPTLPSLLTNKSEDVAELMFNAGVTPSALETLIERTAEGVVEAIPTLPKLSILTFSVPKVPNAISRAAGANICPSLLFPTWYAGFSAVDPTARTLPTISNVLVGFVVPMPTLPSLLTNNKDDVADVIFKAGVFPVALETLMERTAEGEVEAIPTLPAVEINKVEVGVKVVLLEA